MATEVAVVVVDVNSLLAPSSPSGSSDCGSTNNMRIKWRTYFGKPFSVFEVDCEKYLLGVQMAALLRRETYNVYRSLKIKKVPLQRATAEELLYLTKVGAVHGGTHSVTLIPHDDALYFLADALQHSKTDWFSLVTEREKSETPIFRPSLNRRKRPPWEIRRSLPNNNKKQTSLDTTCTDELKGNVLSSKILDSFFATVSTARKKDGDADAHDLEGYESEEILVNSSLLRSKA